MHMSQSEDQQSEDQRSEMMEKASELGAQINVEGEDISNAFDSLRSGDLEAQRLASLGEAFGRQGGALLGRRVGEAIGQKFADEDGTLSFSSIISTLRRSDGDGESEESAGEEGGNGEASQDSDEGGSENGDDENAGDDTAEGDGDTGEDRDEIEVEGDGSGSFEDMSDDELQNLANDLMGELDRRQSDES